MKTVARSFKVNASSVGLLLCIFVFITELTTLFVIRLFKKTKMTVRR